MIKWLENFERRFYQSEKKDLPWTISREDAEEIAKSAAEAGYGPLESTGYFKVYYDADCDVCIDINKGVSDDNDELEWYDIYVSPSSDDEEACWVSTTSLDEEELVSTILEIASNCKADKAAKVTGKHKDSCEIPDQDGVYRCPYSDDPTGDTCRNWCGCGVDE